MTYADAFSVTGKIAGIGGLSIALAYLIFRPLIDTRILRVLDPADRVRILRLVLGCASATIILGVSAYAFSIWLAQGPNNDPSLSVGHDLKVGGKADINGDTKIGNDATVGGDLQLGGRQKKDDK